MYIWGLKYYRPLRVFKKILKVFLWILAGIFGLLMLVCVLVYLPPVQKFAVGKVERIVSESTGMQLSVERFRLRFPLGVSVQGATLVTPAGDTLVAFDRLKANIALLPLVSGDVRATGISLEKASVTYRDTVSAMLLRAHLDAFAVRGAGLHLKDNSVRISRAALKGADVRLELGEGTPIPDTAAVDTAASAAWKFRLRRFDISGLKFAMTTSPNESEIAVDLPHGMIRRAAMDLGTRDIAVKRIRLTGGDYGYFTGRTVETSEKPEPPEQDPAADTLPWTVNVGSVELRRNKAAYGSMYGTPAPGLDFEHIRADSIGLLAEDVRYRGSDISANLRKLELSERSGLRITRGKAGFSMTEKSISLKDLDLATANSTVKADAEVGAGIMQMAASTPVSLTVSASVGTGDVFLLVPLDASVKRALAGQSLSLEGDFNGTLANISINKLAAAMPGHIDFNAHGTVRSINAPENLGGHVSFDGKLRDMEFARGFIADTALRRRIGFPHTMTLQGDVSFSPDEYDIPRFTLTADSGRLDLKGRLAMRSKEFGAEMRFTDFPLHSFLPHDSLGIATLALTAKGHGFDPFGGMNAGADIGIEHLDYNGFAYRDMALSASLAEGKLEGQLTSSNEALSLDLDIGGTLERDHYTAGIKGDVWRADLHRMGFSESTLAVTTRLDISGSAQFDSTKLLFALDAAIDSTVIRIGEVSQRINLTTVKAAADTLTRAVIRSGDLAVDFSSPLPLDSLMAGFSSVGTELTRQIDARNLNADSLQKAIPNINLTVRAGRGNFLREMARLQDMDFTNLSADVSTTAGNRFRIGAEVYGFRTGGLTLDTLDVQVQRHDDRLSYSLRLANRPGSIGDIALTRVYGSVGGNEASLNIIQRNSADSVGFRFGFDLRLLENSVNATMTPQNPIFGYESWRVDEGNYIEYAFDGRFAADLRLHGSGTGKHLNLTSASMQDIPEGALRIEMGGIDIGHLTDLVPTAPPIGGIVSSDLTFGFRDKVIAAKGTLGVGNFTYDSQRVADIDANVDFQSDGTGRMVLDAGIDLEKRTALTAKGHYTKDEMNFAVILPYVPLSVAGAFLPPETAELSGTLDGNITIKGTPAKPEISGDLGFTGGKAEIGMIGTAYGISGDRLTIRNGMLSFNNFGIVAPNNQKLAIDGGIDISDFSDMKADMKISARDFQAVNSTHLGGSQVYGKAALDMGVTAKGPFDGLTIRGNVDLLQSTDIVYILRDQSKNVRDEKQDIVRFTVFADSLYNAVATDTVSRFRSGGMDMLVGVNIRDGLKATLSLDEMSENRVELEGGGELSYSMNSQGDMRLSGRYTLSGGKVYYKLPVISQKIFAVKDGSYVEWAGDPADPAFNVTATLTQKTTLESEGGSSKEVSFDISIAISGSLKGIGITFDVAAPGDLEIQNELSTMSAEQRMQQALSLLVYNQYTGLAYSSQGDAGLDARNQLNQFISKEINQWARNTLKGVDFSMGIDSEEDVTGNTYTNYSYSVSKSLFSDRVKITIGGSVSDNSSAQDMKDNFVDDVTLEYRLTKRDNMFLKVYQYNTQESILEGEVTETGVGFVVRKKLNRLGDLFRLTRDGEKKQKRIQKREERKELREQEKTKNNNVIPSEPE